MLVFLSKIFCKCFNLIPYHTELIHDLFFCTYGLCRIREIKMDPFCISRKNRATFLCIITNRYDSVKIDGLILIHMIGDMAGNVDTIFLHNGHRLRVHPMRFNTGAVNEPILTQEVS